jgi:TatD DNase family protein
VLEATGPPERVVFHCFTGSAEQASRVVEAGWVVSFAGTVTFRNAPDQREACAAVPLDRMVLETDSPFLTPHPYRGEPNRPGRVAVTAATVAAVHGVGVEEVARVTGSVASHAFRLPPLDDH